MELVWDFSHEESVQGLARLRAAAFNMRCGCRYCNAECMTCVRNVSHALLD